MVKWTGSRIAALSLHRQRNSNRTLLLAPQTLPFIVLYAWALQQVRHGVGEPDKRVLVVTPTLHPYPIPVSSLFSRELPASARSRFLDVRAS